MRDRSSGRYERHALRQRPGSPYPAQARNPSPATRCGAGRRRAPPTVRPSAARPVPRGRTYCAGRTVRPAPRALRSDPRRKSCGKNCSPGRRLSHSRSARPHFPRYVSDRRRRASGATRPSCSEAARRAARLPAARTRCNRTPRAGRLRRREALSEVSVAHAPKIRTAARAGKPGRRTRRGGGTRTAAPAHGPFLPIPGPREKKTAPSRAARTRTARHTGQATRNRPPGHGERVLRHRPGSPSPAYPLPAVESSRHDNRKSAATALRSKNFGPPEARRRTIYPDCELFFVPETATVDRTIPSEPVLRRSFCGDEFFPLPRSRPECRTGSPSPESSGETRKPGIAPAAGNRLADPQDGRSRPAGPLSPAQRDDSRTKRRNQPNKNLIRNGN